jgi:hypothetical protein
MGKCVHLKKKNMQMSGCEVQKKGRTNMETYLAEETSPERFAKHYSHVFT